MIRSMTGFGRAERAVNDKEFIVELRSLNGKQFELLLKLPPSLKPFEFEIRSQLSEGLLRGSVECTIAIKQNGSSKPSTINTELAASYYRQLSELAGTMGADTGQLLASILRLPEVVSNTTDMVDEQEWASCKETLQQAIAMLNLHREDEGRVLGKDLVLRIDNIISLQNKIGELAPKRQVKIREQLNRLLEDQVGRDQVDTNRFEQELIYYLEKIDLTEEQVRLSNHCSYFKKLMQEGEIAKGRKLSFLLQEIGREINTMGSKAYDAEIQKSVVEMKDELEKAKEQVLNVL